MTKLRLPIVKGCKSHPTTNNPPITQLYPTLLRERTQVKSIQLTLQMELAEHLAVIVNTQLLSRVSPHQSRPCQMHSQRTLISSDNVWKDREKTQQLQISWNLWMTWKKRKCSNKMTMPSDRTTERRAWIQASANTRVQTSWCPTSHQAKLTFWVHQILSENLLNRIGDLSTPASN